MQALKSYKGLLQSYKGPHPPSYPHTHLNNLESRLTVPPCLRFAIGDNTVSIWSLSTANTVQFAWSGHAIW